MTVRAGGSTFVSWTGRAVSVRRGNAAMPAGSAGGRAPYGRATILIAGPGCWSSPEHAIAAVSGCGFRAVVSNEFNNIVNNNLINAGILPVRVTPEAIAELHDAVESDPGMLVTIDVDRWGVWARGGLVGRFQIGWDAQISREADAADSSDLLPQAPRGRGAEALAGRLLMVQRLLCSADLAGETRMRLQRRLAAICDAVKAPGADAARSAWRIDRLLAELARIGQAAPAQDAQPRHRPR